MENETLVEVIKNEILPQFIRLAAKSIEVQSLMRDGKFIVAHEKMGGIIKIIGLMSGHLSELVSESEKK